MGERKGQNKYYPPDFDPRKHRSLDAYHGTHPLRERARKLDKGILIIRFEMPYNIWCDGCKNHIGMGVRYNAEKSKVGMYYTTPIYKFRMKCHLCNNHFEIKTDPANHDYVIISGARRKEQRWDPKENEQIVPEDKEDQKKMATDAMYKLEHGADDQAKSKLTMPVISQITEERELWKDDYSLNQALRKQFRDKKIAQKLAAEKDKALLEKSSLDIELVPENTEDVRMAELLRYSTVQTFSEKQTEKRKEIDNQSIFTNPTVSSKSNTELASPSSTFESSNTTASSISSSSSSSSSSDTKHQQARKALAHVIGKGKANPFSSSTSSPKTSLSAQTLGIVRRKKQDTPRVDIENDTGNVDSSSSITEPKEHENSDNAKPSAGALGCLASMYSDSDDISDPDTEDGNG